MNPKFTNMEDEVFPKHIHERPFHWEVKSCVLVFEDPLVAPCHVTHHLHKTTIQTFYRAHTNILGSEKVDKLAKKE